MSQKDNSQQVALVLGVTGIVGLNIARQLDERKWKIYGVSRRKTDYIPNEVDYIACDLLNLDECKERLSKCTDTTHIFYATWLNHDKEEDNCTGNGAMMTNLLAVMFPNLVHMVLVTGTKHYLGSFEKMKEKGFTNVVTPFKESMPRPPGINFYYTLEDIMYENAAAKGFTWSVARPCGVIGFAPGSVMNSGTSIAVYASICKYLNVPFTFPGIEGSWSSLCDATDARFLAEHCIWEATTPAAKNSAFNVVNGDVYRWRDLWKAIADYFELPVGKYKGQNSLMEKTNEYAKVWDEMVVQFGLKPFKLEVISGFWLNDMIWSCSDDIVSDMTKSREMGFLQYKSTEKSFCELFDELRKGKFIP